MRRFTTWKAFSVSNPCTAVYKDKFSGVTCCQSGLPAQNREGENGEFKTITREERLIEKQPIEQMSFPANWWRSDKDDLPPKKGAKVGDSAKRRWVI